MTMITETAAVRPFRKAGAVWTAIAYVAAMRENRRTLKEINAMEDHMLGDIGLTRTDVMRANVAEPGSDRMAMLSLARRRRTT
ncbi:MAG: hypothetical protein JWL86_4571 [Rhizobium sp.]|nr:hypothetical protein [Rhizobium sp.]